MDLEMPARVLAAAQRRPLDSRASRLAPFRETLLTLRAQKTSYEKIAKFLREQGVSISSSTVGWFCRLRCPAADIERVRRDGQAAGAAPSATPATGTAQPASRRGPRIARDDF
jgi:hypothetical protein